MKTSLTALAALLFAGAAAAALAQDRDRDHSGGGDRPQVHERAAPSGVPAPAPAVVAGGRPPSPAVVEGHARFGAPPPSAPPVAASGAPAAGQRFNPAGGGRDVPGRDGGGQDGQRGGERHFDRGGGGGPSAPFNGPPTQGGRRGDRNDGPREVAPGAPEHGWDRDHDGHGPGDRHDDRRDGHWNGRGDDRGRDDHGRDDHRDNRHFNPGRWERGRYPEVFWSPNRFHISPYRAPYGFYARSWGFGDFLPRGWFGQSYWIGDFIDYDLPYPPPGFEWVRVGDDAIMVDQYTGRIVQVVRGIFW
jgi:Ni/Co efflux regulator RcnB